MRIFIRSFLAFVFSCVLYINFFMFSAFADEAELDAAPKTWHGHMSTVLNSSLFTNGLSYENSPVSEQIMKIGMDYGREALGWVSFENAGGGGFIFGYYDENRVFHAERQTKAHFIYVNIQETEGDIQPDGRPEIIYSLQVVNGIDSSPVLTMDESVTNLAIISSDGSEIKYKDNIFKGGFECVLADGLISVINYVLLDDYVKGVIPYEMSSYWPYEALRAQAVCARTYAVYNIDSYAEEGFDLTDDTRSQVYKGCADADEATDAAVDSTSGQIIRYKGDVCEVYYFSSDGGATEDGTHVFSVDKPYLAGKTDPFESAVDFTLSSWEFTYTGEQLSSVLNNSGYIIGEVTNIYPSLSHNGNVVALHFFDDYGLSVSIEGRRCYTVLGLHNCNFDVIRTEDGFRFAGSGWGHNCGMSQWGAYAMADVYGYNYEEIIRFYFTGAYVA